MAKDGALTAQLVRQLAERIAAVESTIREAEETIAAIQARNALQNLWRPLVIGLGLLTGVLTFIYLGFGLSQWGMKGLFLGMFFGLVTWVIRHLVQATVVLDTSEVELRMETLVKRRQQMKDQLRLYLGDSEEEAGLDVEHADRGAKANG